LVVTLGLLAGFTRFELARPTFPNELRVFDPAAFAYDRTLQTGWMAERRTQLTKRILKILPGDQGQLLAGILYGERGLSKTTKDAVRSSGLSHLVAVSGSNVTIILSAVMKMLGPLRWSKRRRFVALSLGLVSFVIFVTPQPPVVRAAIMGWLLALAPMVGRLPNFRHLLLVAAVLFTAWRPESLFFNPSFALSFLAMIGLQTYGGAVANWVEEKIKSPMIAELVGSTVGAMLLTTPYAMWAFGQLSLVGLISNIFAVPLVPWAMAFGTIILVIPFPPLVMLTGVLLESILMVAKISAAAPFGIWSSVMVSPWFMFASYAALALAWRYFQKKNRVIHRNPSAFSDNSGHANKNKSIYFT
jgi:competence protein ComEC